MPSSSSVPRTTGSFDLACPSKSGPRSRRARSQRPVTCSLVDPLAASPPVAAAAAATCTTSGSTAPAGNLRADGLRPLRRPGRRCATARVSCSTAWRRPTAVRVVVEAGGGYDDRALGRRWSSRAGAASPSPRTAGGLGLGPVEVAVLLEEIGRHAAPAPFIPTVLALDALARRWRGVAGGAPRRAGGDRVRRVERATPSAVTRRRARRRAGRSRARPAPIPVRARRRRSLVVAARTADGPGLFARRPRRASGGPRQSRRWTAPARSAGCDFDAHAGASGSAVPTPSRRSSIGARCTRAPRCSAARPACSTWPSSTRRTACSSGARSAASRR